MFSPSYTYMMEMEREGCQFFLVLLQQITLSFLFFRVFSWLVPWLRKRVNDEEASGSSWSCFHV
jgi:hypothetical protein